jgi:2-polyprenyl-6-methoxyphenol hydroxylase-like FAD-dependent oxidoreductase
MRDQYDLVIIGAGIAGSALAAVMARAGKEVLLLEQTTAYPDIVRGEVMTQWGVKEARTLGLHDVLLGAGAHHVTRHVGYDEVLPPSLAEQVASDLGAAMPGIPGQLALGHPKHRQALLDAAIAAGAQARRGVRIGTIALGPRPAVEFEDEGGRIAVRARLVVGADGRNSMVRQSAGIALKQDRPRNHMGGMLVENAEGWDANVQTFGSNNDLFFAIFPQGHGRVRVYGVWSLEQRSRFTGTNAVSNFLDAFRMPCCPRAEHIAAGTPAGPFLSYLNNESDATLFAGEGVVLVGDAAGWSDPVIGQGLASAYRDARIVSDILLSTSAWGPQMFAPYETERHERSRRLAFTAELITRLFADFDEKCRSRRSRFFERLPSDPALGAVLGAVSLGPDGVPPETFTAERRAHVLGTPATA